MISQTLVASEKRIRNCISVETRTYKIALTMHLPNADDDGIRRTVYMDIDTATQLVTLLKKCIYHMENRHG